jgi:hypothetical protein
LFFSLSHSSSFTRLNGRADLLFFDMSFPFCSLELKKLNPSSMVFFRAEDGGGGFWPAVARDG